MIVKKGNSMKGSLQINLLVSNRDTKSEEDQELMQLITTPALGQHMGK